MRLGEDFIDEIKARIRLSDLIGRSVQLKRQGREFVGLSPFKKERTPSFTVNDDKRFYHCFSTGKHGDAFKWLEEMEGLSFMEAAERLASEAGLRLPEPDPQAQERSQRRKSLVEWMEAAQAHFARALRAPEAEHARHYLKARGLTGQDCVDFGVGYAPDDRAALKNELVTAGAPLADLVECGLLIQPDSGTPYDRFRDRIMFPIHDPRGRLVAFGGRALSKDAKAKYLNSPETPIFHKGDVLYNFPRARRAAADPKAKVRGLIVAEGYLDVIALDRAGLGYAVAPLGTAITEQQLQLAWRAGGETVMCLDGDAAGRGAALKAADRALPLLEPGKTLRFAFMPDGMDPDDVLRDQGGDALQGLIAETRTLADILWEREIEAEPPTDPDRRANFRKNIRMLVSRIANPDIKSEYKDEFDRRMDMLFGARPRYRERSPKRSERRGVSLPPSAEIRKRAQDNRLKAEYHSSELSLVYGLVECPEIIEIVAEEIADIDLGRLSGIRDAILVHSLSQPGISAVELKKILSREGFGAELTTLASHKRIALKVLGGSGAAPAELLSLWRKQLSNFGVRKRDSTQDEVRVFVEQGESEAVKAVAAEKQRLEHIEETASNDPADDIMRRALEKHAKARK